MTIERTWADTGMDVPKAIGAYQRFVERGVPLLIVFNPGETEALKPRCEKDETPAFTMGVTEASMYPPTWVYSAYPTEAERFAVWCDWIMENWQEERPLE